MGTELSAGYVNFGGGKFLLEGFPFTDRRLRLSVYFETDKGKLYEIRNIKFIADVVREYILQKGVAPYAKDET